MLFACLATFLCVCVGVGGITIACIDINRFNFGLYVALLSVLGTTVSIAFWIVKPKMCDNPRCVQRIINHLRTSFSTSFGGPPKGHSSKHGKQHDLISCRF
ncbi:hypothetical protein Tcan_01879 [Toxocara canis]|uniref:Uncharacterized protein n=1 Tax=Toxocara canis TaxID=6265 RepID=A0A0B2VVJ8_TOXCA|nr:hypothetical protein Tcan_01879 [Toxocara canis]